MSEKNRLCSRSAETPRNHRSPRQSITVSASELRDDLSGQGYESKESQTIRVFEAAKIGDDAVVRELLGVGVNVNSTDSSGRTILQAAAECGHEEVVKMLIEAQANIDTLSSIHSGRTALQGAAGNGHQGIVRVLLDAGADVDASPSESVGRTALQAAAEYGHEEVVQMLLRAGADIEAPPSEFDGRTALQAAAGAGNEKVVKVLLDAGAKVDAPPSAFYGRTALQAAAGAGHEQVVSMLLGYQPHVNALPSRTYGRTALQAAAENGHENVVNMLLKAGAITDGPIAEVSGKTALQAAAGNGHERIVKLILEAEATMDISQSETWGAEVLEAAVGAGHERVVKVLLDSGISINTRNLLGRTCLFASGIRGRILKELLNSGAYIDAQDYDGLTPLHWAAETGSADFLVSLLEAGADMGIEDNRARRPLHIALERHHEDLVKLLLERGDNIWGSRVEGWRMVLEAGEDDIVMISENEHRITALDTACIADVAVGVEFDELLQVRQFYSAFGLDDEIASQLINPWNYMSKYLVITPDRKLLPPGAEIQWIWAIVNPKKDNLQGQKFGTGVPNIGHMTTTARTKALLICYVAFDFFVHKPMDRSDPVTMAAAAATGIPFGTSIEKTQISWVMRKPESDDQRSMFRSMNFRSSFEYGWIPDHGLGFFTLFIQDLARKWREIFRKAEEHLKEARENLLLKEEKHTSIISTLLRDAQQWSDFRSLLKLHVRKAKDLVGEFQEKRILYEEVDSQELPPEVDSGETGTLMHELAEELADEKKKKKKKKKKGYREKKGRKEKSQEARTEVGKLLKMIAKLNSDCKERIKKLERKTKEMIELEFNLVSIFEARISTSTAVSMKRLTWITFIFLPLLFVASLFGMNINLFGDSQIQWWWYMVLGTAVFVLVLAAWACFKHYGAVETWYESLFRRVSENMPSIPFFRGKKGLTDEEEVGELLDKVKYS
ncbi:hypothetical protein Q9L58_000815 [Maublancomyces gigas]|uniref:Uncharacterized protein n=1 Tax=Discina gigas TaxID=1032678 RepID=A0ABR3GW94_9PEZI